MSTQTLAGSSAAVRGFDELSRADVPFAGGKGANLGELSAAGLPVPPGFVVGAPAYAAFVDESGLRERHRGAARATSTSMTLLRSGGVRRRARDDRGDAGAGHSRIAITEAYASVGDGDARSPSARRPPPRTPPQRRSRA